MPDGNRANQPQGNYSLRLITTSFGLNASKLLSSMESGLGHVFLLFCLFLIFQHFKQLLIRGTDVHVQRIVMAKGERVPHGQSGIRHGDFTVSYCHLSKAVVTKGAYVHPGSIVALTGNSGRSTGPHLHITFRNRKNGQVINPSVFLNYISSYKQTAYNK